jgi:hypothetical protein
VAKGSADSTRSSTSGEYSLPLAPGIYVVCFQNSCFNAGTNADEATTLNVRLINGVSSGFLSVPGRGAQPGARKIASFAMRLSRPRVQPA